jgi:putative membrane protein
MMIAFAIQCRRREPVGPALLIRLHTGVMNLVTQLFGWIAVLFHVAAFVMESVLFERPAVQRLLLGRPEAAPGVRLWAFNQGFYNLFLAAGPAIGLIACYAGNETVGRTLVIYGCAFMAACGVVLFVSDRRLWRGMLGQSLPPLIALIAALA